MTPDSPQVGGNHRILRITLLLVKAYGDVESFFFFHESFNFWQRKRTVGCVTDSELARAARNEDAARAYEAARGEREADRRPTAGTRGGGETLLPRAARASGP